MLDAPPVLHPLEPLSAEEVSAASAILKAEKGLQASARFVFISLHEPPKAAVQAGETVAREAFVVLYEKAERKTYEAVVSLTDEAVVSFTHIEGVQPPVTFEEFMACEAVVQADPDWQAAMRLRGVEDFSLAMIDPWAAGYSGPEDDPGARRIVRPLTWLRAAPGEHGYARPIEGLVVVVDLDAMAVIEVADHGVVSLPPKAGNYDPERMADADNVPSFANAARRPQADRDHPARGRVVHASPGHGVAWQKWHVRVGFTPREGLVLHELSYDERPIVYRASLAEMYVPYGDPAPTHRFKNVFDQGEYGVGWLANPLTLGCDCVGEIHYFDGVVNDQDGEPMTIPNAVCMHEEDYGIGWKHTDFRTEEVEVRRLRRLVISSIATVGNYEYGYFWYLYTDGTIEYEVKLTGVISTGAVEPGDAARSTARSSRPASTARTTSTSSACGWTWPSTATPTASCMVDSEPLPWGPENPTGTAWVTKRTVLETEAQARGPDRSAQGPLLADREPGQALRARRSGRLQARPGRERRADVRAGLAASPSGRASRRSTCG